jgi:hypothetical protein
MANWIADKAREIAETVNGREYLAAQYGVEFTATGEGLWLAAICPLCGNARTFILRETAIRLADWRCSGCPRTVKRAPANHGDLIDLVMLREHLEKADAIRRILDRSGPYRAPVPTALDVLRHAGQYFRFMRAQQPAVLAYLEQRGIQRPLDELDQIFRLGGNEVSVAGLLDYLRGALQRPCSLQQLAGARLTDHRGLTFAPAVTAPLWEEDGRFVGLHHRRCGDGQPHYLNRGLDEEVRDRFIYGLHSQVVRQAITDAEGAVVGKGVFDCWLAFQAGLRNVVATLSPGMTRPQFERLCELGVPKLVLGFTSEKELRIVAAMAEKEDQRLHPVLEQLPGEHELYALLHGESVEGILARAERVLAANEQARASVVRRQAQAAERKELQAGRYFVVPIDDIKRAVQSGRGSHRRLVEIVEHHRKLDRRAGYKRALKVPHVFVDRGLHKQLGPALRLLLYLHSKVSGPSRPVTIFNHTMVNELGAALSGIQAQKSQLRRDGLLVEVPPDRHDGAWQYYPLFVPATEEA